MTRKFLLVTYHFPPSAASGSFRMLGLVKHLPRHGWSPVVVAPPTMPWEPHDEAFGKQVPSETLVYPTPYPTGWLTRLGRKLLGPEPVWFPRGLAAARRAAKETKPAVVVTSSPPQWVHFIGLYLKRYHDIPWVADLRDPWVPRGEVGRHWTPPTWLDHRGEALMMKHASAVIANAPLALEMLEKTYPQYRDKLTMVTNGFDPEAFAIGDRPRGDAIRVVHTGELYIGRDPRTFLDALQTLMRNPVAGLPAVRAEFLGRNSGGKFILEAEVQSRGLEAFVTIGGQVSYHQSLRDMAAADILLLIDGPGRKLGVPAKLYEYLGAGRPILALTEPDGDSGWVLRESGVPHRIVPPPGDAASIRAALVELAAEVARGPKVDQERLAKFTRGHMAERIAGLMDRACPPPPARPVAANRLAEVTVP